HTPIDSLDFASPVVGLGSKMGLDATRKWPAELIGRSPDCSVTEVIDLIAKEAQLREAYPQIIDCYFPPQAKDHSMALVSIDKQAVGDGKAMIEALWHQMSQFTTPKFVIICDGDVNVRDWNDVIWAITTRMDPTRDTISVPAGATSSKMGLDATNKLPGETEREWGTPIVKDRKIVAKIDAIWEQLAIIK
ncbi:3-octaprenyl-4-hydroxybenzoate carboxy-lyase, partial [Photobacterium damselae subsp. damselae]